MCPATGKGVAGSSDRPRHAAPPRPVRHSVDNDFQNLWYLENDPDFDLVRPDPRYQAVVAMLRSKLRNKPADP